MYYCTPCLPEWCLGVGCHTWHLWVHFVPTRGAHMVLGDKSWTYMSDMHGTCRYTLCVNEGNRWQLWISFVPT